jgi:hypothetical protein
MGQEVLGHKPQCLDWEMAVRGNEERGMDPLRSLSNEELSQ